MNKCQCKTCDKLSKIEAIIDKLNPEDAKILTDFVEEYIDRSDNLDYFNAVISGKWPNAKQVIDHWKEKLNAH